MKYKLTVLLFERSIGRGGRLRPNFGHCPRREYARDSCETFSPEHSLNLQECTQTAIRLQGLLENLHQRSKLERRCKLNPKNVGMYERANEKDRILACATIPGFSGNLLQWLRRESSVRRIRVSIRPCFGLALRRFLSFIDDDDDGGDVFLGFRSKEFSRKPNYLAFYSKEYGRKAENRRADKHVGSSMVEGECLWQFVLELEANAFEHKYRTRYNEISLKLKASSSSCKGRRAIYNVVRDFAEGTTVVEVAFQSTCVEFDLHLGERTSPVIASR
ncbi:hypothetical protein HZH66_008339 [Vespula vulgaris]|uniref:Uncharacterized protein n=1 Tax=Vespula vulgaris TaxID=7454 RepID=A0A834JVW5_VESVU|nr:hypothetical protein HZH66_008339 [Vespula vulgaris]